MDEPCGLVLATLALSWLTIWANPQGPQVPCFFIFGDSLVDSGNNNWILTLAKANYMPYGIDFVGGVTGRFSNGRTTVDILAQLLGFPNFIPPYAKTKGQSPLTGVNFASGAGGIRDETGNHLGGHLSMNQQLENFGMVVQQMRPMFRSNNSALIDHLSKCIYYTGLGSNDYLNNYFVSNIYTTSSKYTPTSFADVLLQEYSRQLKELYELGARKIVVTALGQIGCIPYELARYEDNGNGDRCNETINKAIIIFNSGLLKLVDHLNNGELPGAKFVYVNLYQSSMDIVANALSYGFEEVDTGCCGVGKNNGLITCLPLQPPCQDRRKYVFWDAFHPTDSTNMILANKSFSSTSKSDVSPINIQQLAML